MSEIDPRQTVEALANLGLQLVFWPAIGDAKGPSGPDGSAWPTKQYSVDEYSPDMRVGIKLGVEIEPGRFLHDVDIDWAGGFKIAARILPVTGFSYGRDSKFVSHCFYTLPAPVKLHKFLDVICTVPGKRENDTLLELRGAKSNGDVGFQSMAPPSIWSDGERHEPLVFRKFEPPTHVEDEKYLIRRVQLAAVAMILARHFGTRGFSHDARLACAGFLLRIGLSTEEAIVVNRAVAEKTENNVQDAERAVTSTVERIEANEQVQGGPVLARLLGEHGNKVITRIGEWIGGGAEDFEINRDTNRIINKSPKNIKIALSRLKVHLAYDEFSDRETANGEFFDDAQVNNIACEMELRFKLTPPRDYLRSWLEFYARQNSHHPVRDYLDSLDGKWDGVSRVETWLIESAGIEDTPYTRAVSRLFLVAAVKRIREPGCKFDEMIILESKQGYNKSTAAKTLCPNPDWFSDDFPFNAEAKRIIEATLGKWIIEAADLAKKRQTDIEQLKAVMSRQVDGPARMAYDRLPTERKRHFVLFGTTNEHFYLGDYTGARRFWPIEVKKVIDVDWIAQHRDQLWAEACILQAKGESIRLAKELWPVAAKEQEKRRQIDPWEDTLRNFLRSDRVTRRGDGKIRVSRSELFNELNVPEGTHRNRLAGDQLTKIMIQLGFEGKSVRFPGNRVEWGFVQVDSSVLEPETDDPERFVGEDDE